MNSRSKLFRLVLSSPWFFLAFLVVPVAVILNLTLHLGVGWLDFRPLIINNICLLILAVCRLLYYLARLGSGIRYDVDAHWPDGGRSCPVSAEKARGVLARAGYSFAAGGRYGEKRDLGYLGTVIIYLGLVFAVSVGCWDNLRQFTGVLLDGPGPATKLSDPKVYRSLAQGPLAGKIELPQLRILSQILPDSTYPKGATEIALVPEQGDPSSALLLPPEPYRYQGYDISMLKLVYQPEIVIRTKDGHTLFDSLVELNPLVQKRGEFSFYGWFNGGAVVGGVYYQPEKNLLMMVVTRNGKKEVADLTFQVDQTISTGDYVLSCARMGQWSEIQIQRHRHKPLLIFGGVLALLGLALRLAVRPRRVWLEETSGGCLLAATGNEAMELLKAE